LWLLLELSTNEQLTITVESSFPSTAIDKKFQPWYLHQDSTSSLQQNFLIISAWFQKLRNTFKRHSSSPLNSQLSPPTFTTKSHNSTFQLAFHSTPSHSNVCSFAVHFPLLVSSTATCYTNFLEDYYVKYLFQRLFVRQPTTKIA
jgi:hypothetical protein